MFHLWDLLTDGTRRHRLLKHKYICTSSIKRVNFNGPQIMPCDPWSDIETVSAKIKIDTHTHTQNVKLQLGMIFDKLKE